MKNVLHVSMIAKNLAPVGQIIKEGLLIWPHQQSSTTSHAVETTHVWSIANQHPQSESHLSDLPTWETMPASFPQ
jgi:hypothetical protein